MCIEILSDFFLKSDKKHLERSTYVTQMQDEQAITITQQGELSQVVTNLQPLGKAATHAARNIDHLMRGKQKKSPETQRRYEYDLKHFQDFLRTVIQSSGMDLQLDLLNDKESWRGMTADLLRAYQEYMLQDGYAIGTINVRIYTVRAFCRMATQAKIINEEEFSQICLVENIKPRDGQNLDKSRPITRKANAKKAKSTLLSAKQVQQILQYCEEESKQPNLTGRRHAVRDKLVILLGFKLALRVGEIAGLTLSSLTQEKGRWILTFDRPKVYLEKQRLEVTGECLEAYQAWLHIRLSETDNKQEPLFNAERLPGQAINTGTLSHRIALLARRVLGIDHVGMHDGRHYWIDDVIENDTDINTFTQAGGWKRATMPLEHYAHKKNIANEGVKQTSLASTE